MGNTTRVELTITNPTQYLLNVTLLPVDIHVNSTADLILPNTVLQLTPKDDTGDIVDFDSSASKFNDDPKYVSLESIQCADSHKQLSLTCVCSFITVSSPFAKATNWEFTYLSLLLKGTWIVWLSFEWSTITSTQYLPRWVLTKVAINNSRRHKKSSG